MLLRRVPARPPVRTRYAALIAVGAGLLGLLAFPRFGIWPLAFASVGSLSVAVHGRRSRTGAWLGFLYGVAFFVPLLHWTGVYVGPAPWLLLAFAEAGFCAAMGAVLPVVQRLPAAPVWVGAVWVAQEAARDRFPFGGFPWGRLAFSQAESLVKWFAALGGAPLVTFVVGVGGGGLALLLLRGWERRWRVAAAGLAVLVAVPLVGALLALPLRPPADGKGRTTTIAAIQGSVPDLGLAFENRARQVLDNHVQQTLDLAADIKAGKVPRPQLVVWPENSSDVDPFTDPIAYAEITKAVHAVGVPILVGAILQGPGPTHRRNAGILWSPTTGPGAEYIKRHPVPFAEYIPFRSIAKLVSSDVSLVKQDMVAGHGSGLLTGGPYPIGDVICFEVAYDGLVRSAVQAGAQLLVVQTNNATFGHTGETYQQLAMTQLRAVEHARTTVQVSTTGESAIIDPAGRILAESGALFTPARLVRTVPLRTSSTLATRLGPVPEYVLTAVALLAIGVSLAAGRAERRRGAPHAPESSPTEEMVNA